MKYHVRRPNPALILAPFSRWTLREEAAQRRLALRQVNSPIIVKLDSVFEKGA